MKSPTYKTLSILLILSCIPLLGLECHWGGDDDDDNPAATETLSTRAEATVYTIDVTTMDVETDDDVILTCDLPTGVVLIVGDRVEVIIDFESVESMWVITGSEFYQKR